MRGKWVALAALIAVLAILPSRGQAQVELLWAAGSFLANKAIADSQSRTIAPCKIVFNVAVIGRDDDISRHMGVWDPSNGLAVWFGDSVELEVVSLKNGPPSDFTIFVNDRLWAFRKVRPGKVEYGKIVGAAGVEGDYPRLRVSELRTGVNQIKVVFRKGEWANAQIQRLSLENFLGNLTEGSLQQIAGAGQAMYPATPVFSALFPDGGVRAFRSAEEVSQAIKELNRPKEEEAKRPPVEPPKREAELQQSEHKPKAELPAQSPVGEPKKVVVNRVEETPITRVDDETRLMSLKVDLRAMPYELQQARRVGAEFNEVLLAGLRRMEPLPQEASPLAIFNDEGLAVFISSKQPFTVALVERDGKPVFSRVSVRIGGCEELMIRLSFDKNEPSRRFVIGQSNRRREINFQRQGREKS